jgi:hypothetical protein
MYSETEQDGQEREFRRKRWDKQQTLQTMEEADRWLILPGGEHRMTQN